MGNACSSAPNNYAVNSISTSILCNTESSSNPGPTANFSLSIMTPAKCANGQQLTYADVTGSFSIVPDFDPSQPAPAAFPYADLSLDIDVYAAYVSPSSYTFSVPTQRVASNNGTWNFPQDTTPATSQSSLNLETVTIDTSDYTITLVLGDVRANVTYLTSDGLPYATNYFNCPFIRSQPQIVLASTVVM